LMLDPVNGPSPRAWRERRTPPGPAETGEEMGLDVLKVVAPLGKIDSGSAIVIRPETRELSTHARSLFLMQAPADAKGKPQKK